MTREDHLDGTYPFLHGLKLQQLSPLQRILLVADGTLTNLLEVYLAESMRIVKLTERVFSAENTLADLHLAPGQRLVEREILLQGQRSRQNWLYAHSLIALERLSKAFQEQLLHSEVPIGKLWLQHQTETFKEILVARQESAGELARYFPVQAQDPLLSRTYRVLCEGQAVMLITEKFPASYFCADPKQV